MNLYNLAYIFIIYTRYDIYAEKFKYIFQAGEYFNIVIILIHIKSIWTDNQIPLQVSK